MRRILSMSMLGILLLAAPAAFSCADGGGSSTGNGVGTATGVDAETAFDASTVEAVEAFPGLSLDAPVYLTWVPEGEDDGAGAGKLAVVEQSGVIKTLENTESVTGFEVLLDIRDRVNSGGEEGLLGLAFDPGFPENRSFYVYYSAAEPRRSLLSRFRAGEGADSEEVLLEVEQPFANHNGGTIAFGPDGYLYLGLGDGGGGGDPYGNAQDPSTLLGSILRLDAGSIAGTPESGTDGPVEVPARAAEVPVEVWAYGFRNPYRFSFDRATGDLWAGDVGQSDREEVDLVVEGGNYGWDYFEGSIEYENPDGLPAEDFIGPVLDYGREQGFSVIGGYVYRGREFPALDGVYFYGDYGTGNIWGLVYRGGGVVSNQLVAHVPAISSFGEDRDGEVYVVSLEGSIYRLVGS